MFLLVAVRLVVLGFGSFVRLFAWIVLGVLVVPSKSGRVCLSFLGSMLVYFFYFYWRW